MSAPFNYEKEFIHGAISEAVSGMSSLNMDPNPIPPYKQKGLNDGYLSEVDYNAQHTMVHLHAVVENLRKAGEIKQSLLNRINHEASKTTDSITRNALYGILDLLDTL